MSKQYFENSFTDMPQTPIHTAHIAVVDDEPLILELLTLTLNKNGYQVSACINTKEFWHLWVESRPDLIILDLNLPDGDGMEICRDIRTISSVPILILTSRTEAIERVVGLEMGADDYLIKPFFPRELVARIKTILRRTSDPASTTESSDETPPYYYFSSWILNTSIRQLIAPDGTETSLTEGELRLLCLFLTHPQQILSRDQIMEVVQTLDSDQPLGRSVDNMVSRLRKRLQTTSWKKSLIQTVRKGGYRLQSDVESSQAMVLATSKIPPNPLRNQKALIASTDATIYFILNPFLQYFGIDLHAATLDEQTLHACKTNHYDIIFIDYEAIKPSDLPTIQQIYASTINRSILVALGSAPHLENQSAIDLNNNIHDSLPLPLRFTQLHAMLSRQLPEITKIFPLTASCMDLLLIAELKQLSSKQHFLRFLNLLTNRLNTHQTAMTQALRTQDYPAFKEHVNRLHTLAHTVGAQQLILTTATLLHPIQPDQIPQSAEIEPVETACEMLTAAIASTRMQRLKEHK